MRIAGFDWDHGNWPKCGKHGVSQTEIEDVLSSQPGIYPDPAHSHAEQRFLAIGRTGAGRHLLIAFTLRHQSGRSLIRPVSARFMHAKEVQHNEQSQKDPGPDNR
mgnify:CR=1 FL=1